MEFNQTVIFYFLTFRLECFSDNGSTWYVLRVRLQRQKHWCLHKWHSNTVFIHVWTHSKPTEGKAWFQIALKVLAESVSFQCLIDKLIGHLVIDLYRSLLIEYKTGYLLRGGTPNGQMVEVSLDLCPVTVPVSHTVKSTSKVSEIIHDTIVFFGWNSNFWVVGDTV